MSNKANQFVEWLDQVEGENLTDYELAKAGKFSHSVLSRARSGIPPKWDVCVKIAGVLNISPITVFRKAGLLPQGTDDEINMDDWRHLLKKMTRQQRDYLMQIGIMHESVVTTDQIYGRLIDNDVQAIISGL